MRIQRALALLIIASTGLPAQTPRVRVTLPAYQGQIAIDTIMLVTDHTAPASRVWAGVIKAFDELKIPIDTKDSLNGILGNKRFNKTAVLAGEPMSKALNCGIGLTGPNADNFRITIAVFAFVQAVSPTRTKLGVGFLGSGADMRGSASDPIACASTGWIEAEIARLTSKAIAGP